MAAEPTKDRTDDRQLVPAVIHDDAACSAQDVAAAPGKRRGQLVSALPSALSQVVATPQAHPHLWMAPEVEQGCVGVPVPAAPALAGLLREVRLVRGHRAHGTVPSLVGPSIHPCPATPQGGASQAVPEHD